ncbi:MAG: diguanylate cyclase domain-containing protein [Psychrobium sp.]
MTNNNKNSPEVDRISEDRYQPVHSSLNTVFITAFSIILILSAIVAMIAYDRLLAFQGLLEDTTASSFPKVMSYAKMYSQVNELTYSTDNLTIANTQGQRKIAYDELRDKFAGIEPLVMELGNSRRLQMQLDVIEQEINALNGLIEQQLSTRDKLKAERDGVYRIHDIAIHDEDIAHSDFAHMISHLVIMSEETLSFKRLNKIKNTSREISKIYAKAIDTIELTQTQRQLMDKLHRALVGDEGVLALKVELLRIMGRTRGRADFVRNLVIDYARLAEFESFKYKSSLLKETEAFSATVEQQTKTLGVMAFFTFCTMMVIVFFIQRRLIRRLVLLNKKVVSRLAGEKSDLKVGGKDEITVIAKSFEEFAHTIERQKKELLQSSLTDGLTNIPNRRALDKAFKKLLLSAHRQQWPITVLMMDVDNFKTYNDFYGHVAGDECLQRIAFVLKTVMRRPEDFVARYGGEEFVCLLPNTPKEGGEIVAATILKELKAEYIPHERSDVASHITLSIGIAVYDSDEEETSDNLLKLADTALYRAKKKGKNCHSS